MLQAREHRLFRFRGGLHPAEKKDARDRPITPAPLPSRLYLPLRQHAGAPAQPLVSAGQEVLKGQLLAEVPAHVSAMIHAPTSGRILSVSEHVAPHPSGLPGRAIVLEPDGRDEWKERNPIEDPFALEPRELARRVEAAGVVGMGGAAFPASVKLRDGHGKVETLVINGAECEPYLTCDDRLMRERAEGVVDGVRLMLHALDAPLALIGIEDNKPEAAEALRRAAAPFPTVRVVVAPTRFPTGSGKQLVRVLTGKEVPAGARSHDIGVLIHNVATAYAVHRALRFDEPLISRVVTVGGGALRESRNFEALVGTTVAHLLECCGGTKEPPARVVLGGPMTGQAVGSMEVPIIKGTCGVLALSAVEIGAEEPNPCIRCGSCVDACPMGLVPLEMAANCRVEEFKGAASWGLSDCILCGSCSYVCPSHIPLVHYFQFGRDQLAASRREDRRRSESFKRAEARAHRLEREAAEKAAAAKARAEARAAARAKKAQPKKAKAAPAKSTEGTS